MRQMSLVVAVVMLVAVGVQGTASAESTVESNVVYGMYSGLALLMDVHHPADPNGYGIIVISGSGWTAPLSPDTAPLKQNALAPHYPTRALLDAGYTLFSINHRAAPRFRLAGPEL